MKSSLLRLCFLTVLGVSASSFMTNVLADGSLCNLPKGKYSGRSIMVQDKATGIIEQSQIELNVRGDNQIAGKIRLYELMFDDAGNPRPGLKNQYYFGLTDCRNAAFKVQSPDLDGSIKIMNINASLGEITITGAINTYEEGIYGMGQWLYDSARSAMGYEEGYPEIDFRKPAIRLRRDL